MTRVIACAADRHPTRRGGAARDGAHKLAAGAVSGSGSILLPYLAPEKTRAFQ